MAWSWKLHWGYNFINWVNWWLHKLDLVTSSENSARSENCALATWPNDEVIYFSSIINGTNSTNVRNIPLTGNAFYEIFHLVEELRFSYHILDLFCCYTFPSWLMTILFCIADRIFFQLIKEAGKNFF